VLPRCPFTQAGRDVSECAGYKTTAVDLSELGGVGLAVTRWQTCGHLGAERRQGGVGFYPACHHPGGVPHQPEILSKPAG
jgi:hypothetical protein